MRNWTDFHRARKYYRKAKRLLFDGYPYSAEYYGKLADKYRNRCDFPMMWQANHDYSRCVVVPDNRLTIIKLWVTLNPDGKTYTR